MSNKDGVYYKESKLEIWKSSAHVAGAERFFQFVKVASIYDIEYQETQKIALLGFCCDEGVRRNRGRVGAQEGPYYIRQSLKDNYVHLLEENIIYDFGDVFCENQNLEEAQELLSQCVYKLIFSGYIPIVLGGGHETAWGTYKGLSFRHSKNNLSIINFDAHFDLRPLINQKGNSGTPFLQIAQECEKDKKEFKYQCIGIEDHANSKSLFDTAERLKVNYYKASNIYTLGDRYISEQIEKNIHKDDFVYISICLDVLNIAYAPGVSACNSFGLSPLILDYFLNELIKKQKIIALDLVELCPRFDLDQRTSKLASNIIVKIISYLYQKFK